MIMISISHFANNILKSQFQKSLKNTIVLLVEDADNESLGEKLISQNFDSIEFNIINWS